jgi:hypothetical protein
MVNVKTGDILSNLPSELDIAVLRPSNQVMEDDSRYRSQFKTNLRVRKGHVLTLAPVPAANNPDYCYINISPERLNKMPIDSDISPSFP